MRKVVCFYEDLPRIGKARMDDNRALVELWKQSWSQYGWEPTVLSIADTLRHKDAQTILNRDCPLYSKSANNRSFLRLCYGRWLAYDLESPTLWADYDVMNYGATPESMQEILCSPKPSVFSLAGCIGYTGTGMDEVIQAYVEIANGTDKGREYLSKTLATFNEISDMTISIELFNHLRLPIEHPFASSDYMHRTDPWHTAKFVHFDHGYTPLPRAASVMRIRNPL